MPAEPAIAAGFGVEYLRGAHQPSTSPKSGASQPSTFAMISEAILVDRELQRLDVSVYGLLACSRRGPFVSLGERRIAVRLHVRRRSVQNSIARLIKAGYLKLSAPAKRGFRARYELTSSVFAAKAKAKTESSVRRREPRRGVIRQARAFAEDQELRLREISA